MSSSPCIAAIPEFDDQVALYSGSVLCMDMERGNGPNRLINLWVHSQHARSMAELKIEAVNVVKSWKHAVFILLTQDTTSHGLVEVECK